MTKHKAIVCDLDQTLIKFEVNWDQLRQIFINIFSGYGFEIGNKNLRPLFEKVADELKLLKNSGIPKKTTSKILNDIIKAQESFESDSLNSIIVYPDTKQFLKNVSEHKLKMGLLTSNISSVAGRIFSKYKIPFDGPIVGQEDVKYPKPNLEGVRKLLKSLNVEGHECIFVGDSDSDMKVAKEIGAVSFFLKRTKNQYLMYSKPNFTVSSLSEIILK